MPIKREIEKKLLLEATRQEILKLFENNKGQYFTLDQLVKHATNTFPWLWDIRAITWLAWGHGLKGEITHAIHYWRTQGIPILSSSEKGKGYTLVDPNDPRTPEYWDSKFLANEKEREQIPISERKLDEKLFAECYRKCEDARIRNELMKVAIKHKIKPEEF